MICVVCVISPVIINTIAILYAKLMVIFGDTKLYIYIPYHTNGIPSESPTHGWPMALGEGIPLEEKLFSSI